MRSWISRINDLWSKCGSRSKKAVREAESVLSDGLFCFQGSFFSPFPCFPYSVSLALFLSCAKIFAKKKGNLML